MNNVELVEYKKAIKGTEAMWIIKVCGKEVGFLTKYTNTKTDVHPWKAFSGVGIKAKFLGAFYETRFVNSLGANPGPDWQDVKTGGKEAALQAVIDDRNLNYLTSSK